GYAGGPSEIIAAMKKLQSQSTSNPSSISQVAAMAALAGDQSCVDKMTAEFKTRHDFVLSALKEIDDVHCTAASGTFYLFPDMRRVITRKGFEDDLELTRFLLDTAGVALVGGSAFGAPGFVRVSYATDLATLQTAMQRLRQALTED
ncbi:MAG: aminotransferase class I/II-fold pyridoxal phosphate-dependent enzyme, partial [Gammaproteobacteria bacterium]|nr:aminotransferase class I/II-fold pyridoxal phosphate-dependent enzyme [Gammaproteobacteria bacterium]